MSFVVEKNIPVAAQARARTGSQFPFDTMEIGDSFLVAGNPDYVRRKARTASAAKSAYSKRTGKTFVARTTLEGYRVWRTS